MINYNLGRVAFVDKGVYSSSTTYNKWDFVTTSDSTYLYINDTPQAGTSVTDTTYWKCLADGKPATTAASNANTAATNANTVATNVANAEAQRVASGSEVKTNKTSDIFSTRQSTDYYPNVKGMADYIDNFAAQTWTLSFRKSGDGSGISTINITTNIDTVVTITNGYLYTDTAGNGQTTSINITHNVATDIHFKVIKNNGFISTQNVIKINSFTDRANSPIPYFSTSNLPTRLTYLLWNGANTASGDIANLPAGLTTLVWYGNNTGTGDIANLPAGLTLLDWYGNNTASGDIANLPTGLISFGLYGNNTASGDIANLPAGLKSMGWKGNNTGTGDIANLPAGLTTLVWAGNNTGHGNIANLPKGITYLIWGGNNSATFSGTRTWAQNMRLIYLRPIAGVFTSAMTDALLISLAGQSLWTNEKTIDLRGNCGARTSASDNAVATLQGYGVTVLTN
jgi:hypothetical protein